MEQMTKIESEYDTVVASYGLRYKTWLIYGNYTRCELMITGASSFTDYYSKELITFCCKENKNSSVLVTIIPYIARQHDYLHT